MIKRLLPIYIPLVLITIWWCLSIFKVVDPIFLPAPLAVAKSIIDGFVSGMLAEHLGVTLVRSLIGFAFSTVIGVPVGLLIGRVPLLAKATQPTIDFFRSVPATALFPLFLFFFDIGDESKISIVFYACSLIIVVNTAYGANQVKHHRILSALIMGATRQDLFWKIILPESAPGIFAGLRIALSMSFVLIVVTEMFIGTNVGLGVLIMNSQMIYRTSDMYGGIMITGIVGYLANKSILVLEKTNLHWVGK